MILNKNIKVVLDGRTFEDFTQASIKMNDDYSFLHAELLSIHSDENSLPVSASLVIGKVLDIIVKKQSMRAKKDNEDVVEPEMTIVLERIG